MPALASQLAIAQCLYDALNARDPKAILGALAPDFVGVVSEGHAGRRWPPRGGRSNAARLLGQVFERFEVWIEVGERLASDDDRVVFMGRYVGTERETGRPVDAASLIGCVSAATASPR